MKVYSFEFGSNAIDWYLNNYNEMNFIGTTSYKFPGNRNFIRVSERIPSESFSFEKGTYFSPAVTIEGPLYVRKSPSNKNPNAMNVTLCESDSDETSHLAIISVDYDCYKLIGYWLGSDQENGPRAEIVKATNTPKFRICVVEFDITPSDESTETFDVLLYNKLFRRYEYYRIYTTNNSLMCEDVTEDCSEDDLAELLKQTTKEARSKGTDFELYQI
jgi:hypothetical protein